jgi:hypothetical protein
MSANKCNACRGCGLIREMVPVILGGRFAVDRPTWVPCRVCNGTGAEHVPCSRCGGNGVIAGMVTRTEGCIFKRTVTGLGAVPCPVCAGRAYLPASPLPPRPKPWVEGTPVR